MVTHRKTADGKRLLVLDFTYTRPDGKKGRYRRDAEVQTRTAAQAEERRRLVAVASKGSPFALVDQLAAKVEAERAPPPGTTFGEVARSYCEVYAVSRLKASSRRCYTALIHAHLLPALARKPVAEINAAVVRQLDAALVTGGMGRVHRRQVHVVLRSIVCRYAVEAGYLSEAPHMQRLPRKSAKLPVVISPEQAARIIEAALAPEHRLALLLAFHAGLRSCEIRGLRVRDVDLAAGVLRVRQAISYGVVDTPKSGNDREVPLTRALSEALGRAMKGKPRDALVSVSTRGRGWGQGGLRSMFVRVAKRAEIVDSTIHHMRHGFVTALLDQGVGAHVVKELAGHADLATTERYAHALSKNKRAAIDALDGALGGAHRGAA
jgi:integrase